MAHRASSAIRIAQATLLTSNRGLCSKPLLQHKLRPHPKPERKPPQFIEAGRRRPFIHHDPKTLTQHRTSLRPAMSLGQQHLRHIPRLREPIDRPMRQRRVHIRHTPPARHTLTSPRPKLPIPLHPSASRQRHAHAEKRYSVLGTRVTVVARSKSVTLIWIL